MNQSSDPELPSLMPHFSEDIKISSEVDRIKEGSIRSRNKTECFSNNMSTQDISTQSIQHKQFSMKRRATLSIAAEVNDTSLSLCKQFLPNLPQGAVYYQDTIYRKESGFLSSWTHRLMILTNSKIYFFQDESRTLQIACIPIKYFKLSVKVQGQLCVIEFEHGQESIQLRAKSNAQASLLQEKISDVIEFRKNERKISIKKLNRSIYEQKDFILQKQFLNKVESGDILLASSQNSISIMQKFLTHSEYNHVALLYKFNGEVKIFQANQDDGVQIYDWSQYLRIFKQHKKLAWRKLVFSDKSESEAKLKSLVKEYLGHSYSLSASKLFKKSSKDEQKNKQFFCSELVARIYKMIGILDRSVSSSSYWPINFTSRGQLALLEKAYLTQEKTILLQKHLKLQQS